MIGHNIGLKACSDKDSSVREASRKLKQRLKGKRIKKRLKEEDCTNQLDEGSFLCCEMKFETEQSFRKHQKEVHNKDVSDTEDTDYPCKFCGIMYGNKEDHSEHIEKQHGVGKANACPLCLVVLEDRIKR